MNRRLATATTLAILAGVLMHDWQGFVVVVTFTMWVLTETTRLDLLVQRDYWRDLATLRAHDLAAEWAAELGATPHDTTVAEVLGSVTPLFQSVVSESNPPAQPPRCGECRMGLGVHNHADLLCEARPTIPPASTDAGGRDD